MDFGTFFREAMNGKEPYPYQALLAESDWPETRVIPTGFGKTAAILGAWLLKLSKKDAGTPRRLIYCLPMRTLVEQTEKAAQSWIHAADRLLGLKVHLDVLMGGRDGNRGRIPDWIMRPERPTILIGTQDLLVSAALMRGYGVSRYRWPVDFALLHNDALWIFDEVQLTGATLVTSAQLEAFRRTFGAAKPSRTLWMSATLDPAWLGTVDFMPADKARPHDLSTDDLVRAEHLWNASKRLTALNLSDHDPDEKRSRASYTAELASAVRVRVRPGANTILFVNTVARAQAVYEALQETAAGPELLLIHSRFRAADRANRMERLGQNPSPGGRIIVATQALEAGVDVTSAAMITEIAPWSSIVQRLGRCNRYGECGEAGAEAFWTDLPDDMAAPYSIEELREARGKLNGLLSCNPADLAGIPLSTPPRGHVIRTRDLLDLFDTEPDLSGFDIDVSLYVRDAGDTDVRLFWRPVAGDTPSSDATAPLREELCPAPIGGAKELVKRSRKDSKQRAWRWDALAKEWRSVREGDVFPGLVLWIDSDVGGYLSQLGFTPASKKTVEAIGRATDMDKPEAADEDADACIGNVRVSLAKHTVHVLAAVDSLAEAPGLGDADYGLLSNVALWHDVGKAHPAFVALTESALTDGVLPPLAKWPKRPKGEPSPQGARKYFRHELVSALAFLAHGDWSESANLPAYLIAAHHGKVRMCLRALPKEKPPEDGRLFARGVWDGDMLPATKLGNLEVPETKLDLDLMQLGQGRCGASWSARTQKVLSDQKMGPFRLAWIEALLRIADWRASNAEEHAGHDDL